MKRLIFCAIVFTLLVPTALALNVEFNITLPKPSFYPNETVPINVSLTNREFRFAAKNLSLEFKIGQRNYLFKFDDLSAGQSSIRSLTLPEQPSGTYIIRGILNYIGYVGETVSLETYNSFDVKFPEIKRLPRNIYIKSLDLPSNVTVGEPVNVSVIIANNGTIAGDLVIKVDSTNVSFYQETHLEPGEIKTILLSVNFPNAGVTLVEAKVYAIADNIKYLLNYLGKNVYVQEIKKEFCISNNQCTSDEICTNGNCVKLSCDYCQYPKDHTCNKYQCCSDTECTQLYTCDLKLHICKPPQCTKDTDCADNEICTSGGKCKKAFTLVVVPLGISSQDENNYMKYASNELLFFRETSPLKESITSQSKNLRIHYISPSLCKSDTKCSHQSSYYCYEEMAECAKRSGLIGIADKLVGIVDKPIGVCGFAPMGGFYNINKLGCKGTPAHELGHNLDLGHINCVANDMWTCIQPNAEDCNEPDKSTDIMSYCSEDHYGPQAYRYMKDKYFKGFLEGT